MKAIVFALCWSKLLNNRRCSYSMECGFIEERATTIDRMQGILAELGIAPSVSVDKA